jgi:alanyl-tRNA synthetase
VTERLYYLDPYLKTFTSHIVSRCEYDGQPAVELQATAFYPTAGGQPHDTGTLNTAHVVDVQAVDDDRILHVLDRPIPQAEVRGEIDWSRRFDHMQQHTGQHILSQAFSQICKAETVGFHMGESLSTIDLDRAPLAPEYVQRAEQAANEVTMSARPVTARFVDDDELTALPLRKMPTVDGPIRIVQVQDYDWSACGGTHVLNSGQVGPIKVVRIERRKEKTRIHFVCGRRALADYASKHETVQALAGHLTTSESELLPSIERMEAQIKQARKENADLQTQLLGYQVKDWLDQGDTIGSIHVVRLAFDERDINLLKETARRLTEQPGVVALLATRQPRPQFVFARADDVDVNVGTLIRASCAVAGGRGGGRPQFAQGGTPEGSPVEPVLNHARQQLASL